MFTICDNYFLFWLLESDVPAELQVLQGPQQQPTFPFAVANQLLLVSLLEHLSHVHEPNAHRSRRVFQCQYEYLHLSFFKVSFFIFREMGREEERERNISGWLPLLRPLLGTWPTTQAHALTGNQTCDPLVPRLVLNPLSHTSQGRINASC